MRPYWHFCGMAAAASSPPSPNSPESSGRRLPLRGSPPMHQRPAKDNQGMDAAVTKERR